MHLELQGWLSTSHLLMQRLALVVVASLGTAGVAWSFAASAGWVPWLHLQVGLGAAGNVDAGMAVQLTLTLLLLGLCFFLPTNVRVMELERTHRDFRVSMADVASAYVAAHAADRQGAFNLRGEFDSVRARLVFLRQHADLGALEPEILGLAAQMSHESRELATVYSEERVEHAREFLKQRQEDAEGYQDRARQAHAVCHELRHWLERVETEEAIAHSQLKRLKVDLDELLPHLGFNTKPKVAADVVSIARNQTAK